MSSTPVPLDNVTFQPPAHAPQWFLDNIRQPGTSHYAAVDGGRIHFLAWNLQDESLPVLMFVHGFGGHAHWWSFLMPFFAERYRVIAIDLPGMGDSSHRAEYDIDCFAKAILGVIRQYQLPPLTLVGHSFGGVHCMYAMKLAPELFRHGIVIDSNIWFPQQRRMVAPPMQDHKRRPTRQECMARFSLTPPQPVALDYLMDYVGYHSCLSDESGWHWKFDYRVRTASMITDAELLTDISVPVDCIYGELSVYNKPDLPEAARRAFANLGELVVVPEAHHHIAMDHPLELVAAINGLLAEKRG
jgi:pimeloyl-ACP methyl ester carboxylesterase